MKKITYLLVLIFGYSYTYSQGIGINTSEPTADFHLKASKDYIIKLPDLASSVSGEEKVIVSDDTKGTVSAKPTNIFKNIIFGSLPATASPINISNTTFTPTTITIGLPKGRWAVHANILLDLETYSTMEAVTDFSITVEATLGENVTSGTVGYSTYIEDNDPATDNAEMEDFGYGLFKGVIKAPLPKAIMKGVIIINNSRYRAYRLHIRISTNGSQAVNNRLARLGSTNIKENQIYAIPLD